MASGHASSTPAAQGASASGHNHNGAMASQHNAPAAGSTQLVSNFHNINRPTTHVRQQTAQDAHASATSYSQTSGHSPNGISASHARGGRDSDHQKDDIAFAHIGAQFTR
ncbi:hypothetical protein E4U55_004651 [Claviceps digitariae]|nr:hypothetical protein E4U55_004651 [Claviceps digitariae]